MKKTNAAPTAPVPVTGGFKPLPITPSCPQEKPSQPAFLPGQAF